MYIKDEKREMQYTWGVGSNIGILFHPVPPVPPYCNACSTSNAGDAGGTRG